MGADLLLFPGPDVMNQVRIATLQGLTVRVFESNLPGDLHILGAHGRKLLSRVRPWRLLGLFVEMGGKTYPRSA